MNPWYNDTNLKDEDFDNLYDSIDFIKAHEGFSPSVYPDVGNKKANIGYGFQNTGLNEIDRTTADRMLNNYLKNQRSSYRNSVYTDKMTPWGRTVADDLLYRGGYGSLKNTNMLKALQMGNDEEVAKYLPEYKYATDPETKQKKAITGLMNRNDALMKVRDSLNKINVRRVDNDGQLREQVKSNPLDIFNLLNRIESQPTYFNPIRGEETPAFVNKLPVVDETYVNPNSWNASDILNIAKGIQPSIKMTPSPSSSIQPEDVPKIEQEIQEEKTQQDDNISKSLTPILGQNEEVEAPKTVETTEPKKELTEEEKLQNLINEYKNARNIASERDKKIALIEGLSRAGGKIGATIANSPFDSEGYKLTTPNSVKNVDAGQNELYKLQSLARDLALAKERAAAKKDLEKEKGEAKSSEETRKWLAGYAQRTNPTTAGTRTPLGKARNVETQVDNMMAMLSSHKPGEITNIELKEALRDFDTIVSGGNATVGGYKSLDAAVTSLKRDLTRMKDYITSKPNEMATPELLDRLKNTALRIKNLSQKSQYLARKYEARGGLSYKDSQDFKNAHYDLSYPEDITVPEEQDRNLQEFENYTSPSSKETEVLVLDKKTGRKAKMPTDEAEKVLSNPRYSKI